MSRLQQERHPSASRHHVAVTTTSFSVWCHRGADRERLSLGYRILEGIGALAMIE
jgi:hypothetical protein